MSSEQKTEEEVGDRAERTVEAGEREEEEEGKSIWKKKKRGTSRNQLRSRLGSNITPGKEGGGEEDNENGKGGSDETDVLERLNKIREAQTLRASFKRRGGIQADSADGPDGYTPEPKRARGSDEGEGGAAVSTTTSDGKYLAGLNSSHAARAGDITDHTSRMEKYIQEKINEFQESRREQEIREQKIRQGASLDEWDKSTFGGSREGGPGTASGEKGGYESYEAKQKKLFEIPDKYKAESKLIKDSQNKIAWITGISEVELPLSYKLKNIQETEEAKKKLLSNPVVFKSTDRKLYRFTNVLDKDNNDAKD